MVNAVQTVHTTANVCIWTKF